MSTVGKVISCKAAVLWELNTPFSIETVEVQPPGPGDVRIKVVAVALCHTDVTMAEGYNPLQPLPFVTGHEGAGIVESVGDGVTSVNPGDHVLTSCLVHCGQCEHCLDGRSNACLDIGRTNRLAQQPTTRLYGYDGKPIFFCKGQLVYSFLGCSSFSEYTVIAENSCVKINPEAPLDKVCMLACGFSTGYGSSSNSVTIRPGDITAVWGLGGVGLAAVIGCKEKKAGKIIGIDVNSDKEAIARKLGCTDFIALNDIKEPLQKVLIGLTKGGLHFGFVCVGNTQAMEQAVSSLRPGGTAVVIGVANGDPKISVDHRTLLYSKKITGCFLGGYNMLTDIPKLVTHYINGGLPLDDLITGYYKLEEINDAVKMMKEGKGIRSVILM